MSDILIYPAGWNHSLELKKKEEKKKKVCDYHTVCDYCKICHCDFPKTDFCQLALIKIKSGQHSCSVFQP